MPIIKQILYLSKKYSFPGFNGVPIYNVVVFFFNELKKDKISTRANSIAFSFFLAIFPSIIFVFTLLPIVFQPSDFAEFFQKILPNSQDVQETSSYLEILEQYLSSVLPENATSFMLGIVEGIVGIQRNGLLSLGFILAVFFSSSGMRTCLLYTSPSPRDRQKSRMPSSA